MPNFIAELRREIRRLARKETKQEVGSLRKQVTVMRRRVAQSNRQIRDLEARLRVASRQAVGRGRAVAMNHDEEADGKQVRFSPAWVKKHRKKLHMSRRVYAQLLNVSAQTIMGWESGRTRPRRGALRQWRDMRSKGIRELKTMLNGADADGAGRGRRGRRKKAVRRRAARRAVRGRAGATRRTTRRVVRRRKRSASGRPRVKARTRRARARRR